MKKIAIEESLLKSLIDKCPDADLKAEAKQIVYNASLEMDIIEGDLDRLRRGWSVTTFLHITQPR